MHNVHKYTHTHERACTHALWYARMHSHTHTHTLLSILAVYCDIQFIFIKSFLCKSIQTYNYYYIREVLRNVNMLF